MTEQLAEQPGTEALCKKVPKEVREAFAVDCKNAGASEQDAQECIADIIRLVALEKVNFDIPNTRSGLSADVLKPVHKFQRNLNCLMRDFADMTEQQQAIIRSHAPMRELFFEGRKDVTAAELIELMTSYGVALERDCKHLGRSSGGKRAPEVEIAILRAAMLWRNATGKTPPQTKSTEDGSAQSSFVIFLQQIAGAIDNTSSFYNGFTDNAVLACLKTLAANAGTSSPSE